MQYINKTTLNFAQKRNMDITDHTVTMADDSEHDAIWIWSLDNEMEPVLIYLANSDGSFTFHSHILPQGVKEELPATIFDEKQLRQVIKFLADNMECNGL